MDISLISRRNCRDISRSMCGKGDAKAGSALFRIDRDHRLAGGQVRLDLAVQVHELRITVLVLASFILLCVRLQAVAQLVEEFADGNVAQRIALAANSPAAVRVDFVVQRSGHIGSPGSLDRRGRQERQAAPAGRRSPSVCRLPARIRAETSNPASTSLVAFCTVDRLIEVALATALMPPRPKSRAPLQGAADAHRGAAAATERIPPSPRRRP